VFGDHLHPALALDEGEDVAFDGREIGRVPQVIAAPGIAGDHQHVEPLGRHRPGEACAALGAKVHGHDAHSGLMPPRSTMDL
jgi:hypothetical protein